MPYFVYRVFPFRRLEKIGDVPYAFPFIDKHQNPIAFAATRRRG